MKVIEPLFLNELKEAFEDAIGNEKKLKELLHRIAKIKLFDPACGSGNFLIIAYKELRRLEMLILKELGGFAYSGIHLNNFYGIELDDFAHEIAKLSLWLAEHQMNVEFFNEFGRTNPTLPLQEAGQIVCGNACRLDWEKVCPKNINGGAEPAEVYIMGNPPYLGARMQESSQKDDIAYVLKKYSKDKKVDYITCWFIKASEFILDSNCQFAFVSTNSICQGEQVGLIWPNVLRNELEISFAHTSFKWNNNAKSNAGVICIIVGVCNIGAKNKKVIFKENLVQIVKNINPYLTNASNVFIGRRSKPISYLPNMVYGELLNDGGNLILSTSEKDKLIESDSSLKKIIKRLIGALEFLRSEERWALYISDSELIETKKNSVIFERLKKVKEHRLNSTEESTRKLAEHPNRYYFSAHNDSVSIIVPTVSSERRKYIPIGYLTFNDLIIAPNQAIYNAEPWHFSIITSRMHMTWVRAVGGRLKSDYRYSSNLCYNTFPFTPISNQRKQELTQCTFRILEEREKHPEKTLAQLYDPDKMPEGLKEAHRLNDEAVERCYRSTPFNSDEERLEYLFKLYEKMIQEEKEKGTLFEAEKKTRKKK
jgi:hypothetical protein